MKVKELITELSKMNPESNVYAVTESGYVLAHITKVYPDTVNFGENAVLINTEYVDLDEENGD